MGHNQAGRLLTKCQYNNLLKPNGLVHPQMLNFIYVDFVLFVKILSIYADAKVKVERPLH